METEETHRVSDFIKSDFYKLFTSFVKGEVTQEILNGCGLFYECKICKRFFAGIRTFAKHYAACNRPGGPKDLKIQQNNVTACESIKSKPPKVDPLKNKIINEQKKRSAELTRNYVEIRPKIPAKEAPPQTTPSVVSQQMILVNGSLFLIEPRIPEMNQQQSSTENVEIKSIDPAEEERWSETPVVSQQQMPLIDGSAQNEARELKNYEEGPPYSLTLSEEQQKMLDFEQFRCRVCNDQFPNRQSLARHFALEHLGYKELERGSETPVVSQQQMPLIDDSAQNEAREIKNGEEGPPYSLTLNREQEKMLDFEKNRCRVCNDQLPNRQSLACHFAFEHLGYKKFMCRICGFKTDWKGACEVHASEIHGVKEPRSIFCYLRCKLQSKRKIMYNEDAQNGNIVDNCGRPIKKEDVIDEQLLTCLVCDNGRRYVNLYSLRHHFVFCHLGNKKLGCKLCDFKSNSAQECREHLETIHDKRHIHEKYYKQILPNINLF